MIGITHGLRFRYWTDEGWFVGQLLEHPSQLMQARSLQKLKQDLWAVHQFMRVAR